MGRTEWRFSSDSSTRTGHRPTRRRRSGGARLAGRQLPALVDRLAGVDAVRSHPPPRTFRLLYHLLAQSTVRAQALQIGPLQTEVETVWKRSGAYRATTRRRSCSVCDQRRTNEGSRLEPPQPTEHEQGLKHVVVPLRRQNRRNASVQAVSGGWAASLEHGWNTQPRRMI
jgi:hypothetical protein